MIGYLEVLFWNRATYSGPYNLFQNKIILEWKADKIKIKGLKPCFVFVDFVFDQCTGFGFD